MSIDKFYNKRFNETEYNCAHLVCEAWEDETGVDITRNLQGFLLPPSERRVVLSNLRPLTPLAVPASPCIVLMQQRRHAPHVGLFLRGKVLHIKATGVEYQPLEVATLGFNRVRFYTC
jgi:hypothetical protein